MLLLYPFPTCDAVSDLCTFCPDLCTFCPDLCTLCPDLLHLALVVLSFYQPVQVLHLHTWWWSLAATCAGGVSSSAIGANIPCTSGGATYCNLYFHPLAHILTSRSNNLHCAVVVCGTYIYIYILIIYLGLVVYIATCTVYLSIYQSTINGVECIMYRPRHTRTQSMQHHLNEFERYVIVGWWYQRSNMWV